MGYKSLKCKLLFYLSRIVPDKDFKMLYKQYLKYCDAVPEMSKEIRKCIFGNYKFRRQHRGEFKIISLGWSCLPRTLLTLWMLKPSKGVGEKGMPFDLIASPPAAITHFLKTDFADYFEGNWVYKTTNGHACWHNEAWENMLFPHEIGLSDSEEDLTKLKSRVAKRIENFREAVTFDGPVLFVLHKATWWEGIPLDHKAEDIECLAREISRLRGNKPFKILAFSFDHDDACEKLAGCTLVRQPYPHAKYIWHEAERFTSSGLKFEMQFMETCRRALSDLLNRK
ncbi:MAG: hypothetical protein IKC94_05130 [Lentisphaeria bacterium]|nr:hypothetical protein [Lentisphaeria bacterium]